MSNCYKIIKGVQYDRSLLDEAQSLITNDTITKPIVKQLWASACDGQVITDIEKQTLVYIFKSHKADDDAKTFFKLSVEMVDDTSKGYYKTVNGHRYDRSLLKEAIAELVKGKGKLDIQAASRLWESAADGPGVTETEERTLQTITEGYPLSEEAVAFLREKLATHIVRSGQEGKTNSKKDSKEQQLSSLPTPSRRAHSVHAADAAREKPTVSEASSEAVAVKESKEQHMSSLPTPLRQAQSVHTADAAYEKPAVPEASSEAVAVDDSKEQQLSSLLTPSRQAQLVRAADAACEKSTVPEASAEAFAVEDSKVQQLSSLPTPSRQEQSVRGADAACEKPMVPEASSEAVAVEDSKAQQVPLLPTPPCQAQSAHAADAACEKPSVPEARAEAVPVWHSKAQQLFSLPTPSSQEQSIHVADAACEKPTVQDASSEGVAVEDSMAQQLSTPSHQARSVHTTDAACENRMVSGVSSEAVAVKVVTRATSVKGRAVHRAPDATARGTIIKIPLRSSTVHTQSLSGEFCWDYEAGFCRRGPRCRWPHTGGHEDLENGGGLDTAASMASLYGMTLDDVALHELATLPGTEMAALLAMFDQGGDHETMREKARSREVQRFCRRYRAESARKAYPGRCTFEPPAKRRRAW